MEGDSLEDVDVHGRIILKSIFKKWEGFMDLTDLAQHRNRWGLL